MNTPTPEETRRLLDVENYGGKALFEFSPDSYDKVNDLIALYKSTAQRADALAEELAASNKRREELHRRIKDLEFQLHGNDTFDKLTSLQAENGRKDQLLASLGDLLKECAEKLDRYANRQTAKRALPQGGFADNRASEGQHYAQIQSLIDRARNWRKALTPPPDATERKEACSQCGSEVSDWVDVDKRGRVCRSCESAPPYASGESPKGDCRCLNCGRIHFWSERSIGPFGGHTYCPTPSCSHAQYEKVTPSTKPQAEGWQGA